MAPTVEAGSDDVVICKGAGRTWIESTVVALTPALSATLTVKADVPAAEGVPLIVPVGLRLSPPGREPELSDHVYGGDPPNAMRTCEYGVPTVPPGSADVMIPRPGALMVSDNAAVAEAEALSVTFTVKLADPAVLAVPDIVPASERLRPAGRVPLASDHE